MGRSFSIRWYLNGFLFVLALFVSCGHAWGALAALYEVTDISPPADPDPYSRNNGTIDDSVIAMARDDGTILGFRFTDTGVQAMQFWPTVRALSPDDPYRDAYPLSASNGQVVGVMSVPTSTLYVQDTYAVRFTPALQVLPMQTPLPWSAAECINTDGDIWGEGDADPGAPPSTQVSLVWLEGRPARELPTLHGLGGYAMTCNDGGFSAGFSWATKPQSTDYVAECTQWPVWHSVASCHPRGADDSRAVDLNNANQLVGNATIFGRSSAYLWTYNQARWLFALPGHTTTVVHALNDLGDAVGQSCAGVPPGQVCTAVRWDEGRPLALLPMTVNAQGWAFTDALGTTNDGKIAVVGTLNGVPRLGLLTPVETPVSAYWRPWQLAYAKQVRDYWRWVRAYWRGVQRATVVGEAR